MRVAFVRTTDQRYDVIVADNYHPARSGTGSLYTVEHFALVFGSGSRPAALFCQWLPLHQLEQRVRCAASFRPFLAVYPHGWALVASNSLETPVLGASRAP